MVLFILLLLAGVSLYCGVVYAYKVAFFNAPERSPISHLPICTQPDHCEKENISRMSKIMASIAHEEICIESYDHIPLYGRYYHTNDGAPLGILFHGYRSSALLDCCGFHALLRKMGFNILVIDHRAHGNSKGTTITFGIKERLDCYEWVQYAVRRFGNTVPIILFGISMGASTVLMSLDRSLPDNVCCVIADSAYTSPMEIIEKICSDKKYPVGICRLFILLAARWRGNFCLKQITVTDTVEKAKIPILLIHGEADSLVPCSMSERIQAANPHMVVHRTFPNAGHGLSYLTDPLRYEQIVYEFFKTIPQIGNLISERFKNQRIL